MSGLSNFDFPFINNPDSANMLNQLKQFRAKTKAFYEESDAILRDYEARIAALDDSMTSHTHTKASVGLGNVDNYATATQAEAEAGSVNDKLMTPLRTKQGFDARLSAVFGGSNQGTGFQKLPGGLIVQWLTVTTSTASTAITWPTAFTGTAYAAIAACKDSLMNARVSNFTTTGATLYFTQSGTSSYTFTVIAVGF